MITTGGWVSAAFSDLTVSSFSGRFRKFLETTKSICQNLRAIFLAILAIQTASVDLNLQIYRGCVIKTSASKRTTHALQGSETINTGFHAHPSLYKIFFVFPFVRTICLSFCHAQCTLYINLAAHTFLVRRVSSPSFASSSPAPSASSTSASASASSHHERVHHHHHRVHIRVEASSSASAAPATTSSTSLHPRNVCAFRVHFQLTTVNLSVGEGNSILHRVRLQKLHVREPLWVFESVG